MSADAEIPQWEEILILRHDRDAWCERAGELLTEVNQFRALAAEMEPHLRQLADWFDVDDEFKTTMFPATWPQRGNEVQTDLRRWADLLRERAAEILTEGKP